MRGIQYQHGTWEPSQHLLKDRAKKNCGEVHLNNI
jgi:hypothetical protein